MTRIIDWVEAFAMSIGGPGLFVIAFLDSSFLSLPEINDLLVVWMVTRHKERMIYYALMATMGSIAGCGVLYVIGRKGGDAFLRRRFHAERIDRALATFDRYGLFALLVPAILPPPAPFKIFVLMAGVARMRPGRFALAIGVGRGFRYFMEGWLAVQYGDRAVEFLQTNGRTMSIVLVITVVVVGVAYGLWRKGRRFDRRDPQSL